MAKEIKMNLNGITQVNNESKRNEPDENGRLIEVNEGMPNNRVDPDKTAYGMAIGAVNDSFDGIRLAVDEISEEEPVNTLIVNIKEVNHLGLVLASKTISNFNSIARPNGYFEIEFDNVIDSPENLWIEFVADNPIQLKVIDYPFEEQIGLVRTIVGTGGSLVDSILNGVVLPLINLKPDISFLKFR